MTSSRNRIPLYLLSGSFCLALCGAMAEGPASLPPLPKVAPLAYFEDRCSRCHGPQGSFYGDDFGKKLTEAQLRDVVESMCRVQGDSPLKGTDLDAQIAYHRALIAKEPFVAVTRMEGELSGEVTEKAAVTVEWKTVKSMAIVKGTSWKAAVPDGLNPRDAQVRVCLGKSAVIIDLKKAAFSHGTAIPAPIKPSAP